LELDARFVGIWIGKSRTCPGFGAKVARFIPNPSARATKLYDPATILNVSDVAVAGSVSATGTLRAS
jgi:hypothetical protein